MNIEELVNYIEVGMTQPVVVDRTLLTEYGRYIRVIGFLKDNKILISYYFYDGSDDDTGVDIKLQYESLDTAIQSIEQFLGLSIDQWENYNRTGNYPEPLVDFVEDKWADLIAGIQQGTMIPQGYSEIYMNL
ncbi:MULTISPECIES: hypothetical protein [Acinetobacter]|jgi:hypothetical protein|uniref:hypothetical protein n=1 Tax=Acinetobacter TaxID=469 RepID=UPI0002AE90A6|nr:MULTISPECIES: hypothetical protein [Acinetobacter]ELW89034.1 hypothetical protein ACINWC743_0209 [Acinetobacter sp. WC-743]KKW78025.1 hypothetical protein AAV97_11090 [Acinetobacter sp. Ag2]MBI0395838.1 hypothetical protein [Acinetobacter bereziniae]MBJ8427436.1 hypothetical protein [Acinetobacter bereziniae]MBJ8446023.1 hypothetical protein [Acinetobacter bereziniae]